MKPKLHALLGTFALLCVSAFWISSFVSELFLSPSSVVAVKNTVLTAMWLFIPAMAATGASGLALGRNNQGRLFEAKKRRMQIAAVNGLIVLLPCAYTLAAMANAGRFDGMFYAIQGLELAAGGLNVVLLARNMRDGLRLSGRLSPRPVST
jgi:Na+-driven multidrug efflux pump